MAARSTPRHFREEESGGSPYETNHANADSFARFVVRECNNDMSIGIPTELTGQFSTIDQFFVRYLQHTSISKRQNS
jgi:hypothetical protein